MRPWFATRIMLSVCVAMSVLASVAAAQEPAPTSAPPVLIKLLAKRGEREQDHDQVVQTEQAYAVAKHDLRAIKDIESDPPSEARANALSNFDSTVTGLELATAHWMQTKDELRRLEEDARAHGLKVPPGAAEQASPLGPSRPNHDVHGGSLLKYLVDHVAPDHQTDPTKAGRTHFDGDRGRGMTAAEFIEQLENSRQTVLRDEEFGRIAAARVAEQERQREIKDYVNKLVQAMNEHVRDYGKADTPAKRAAYNKRTLFFMDEYKKWTGKDLSYETKEVP